jgi:hypothetical protein
VAIAPVTHADIYAQAHADAISPRGGYTPGIAGDVVTGVAIAAATDPYWAGEEPCYTVEGMPYYTPDGDPG